MPRTARIHVPGVFQHVMARGIDGRDIFIDDADRDLFLRLLSKELQRAGHRCYAWVLMRNHYHALLRTSEQRLGIMMRRLNSCYARYYGKRYKRHGYLFQDRFKSIATQDQWYVEEIIRYIHLNPVRAGICTTLAQLDHYRWSGHAVLMGNREAQFQDTATVLRRFGKTIPAARSHYRSFIAEGLTTSSTGTLIEAIRKSNKGSIHNVGSWVIGDPDFIRTTLQADRECRIRVAAYQAAGWDLERLASFVSERMGVGRDRLLYKSKRSPVADARKVFCFLGCRKLGFTATQCGDFLGVSLPAVSFAVKTGERIAEEKKIEIGVYLSI